MELDKIAETYGALIWKVSNKYHTGIWEPIDVYQEILIKIYVKMESGHLPITTSKESQSRVKSFIITKAIDIVRKELYRRSLSSYHRERQSPFEKEYIDAFTNTYDFFDDDNLDPEASMAEPAVEFEVEIIREVIRVRLNERDAKFVEEMTFPSRETVDLAERDRLLKKQSKKLHMNVNKLKITTNHVAQALSQLFGKKLSKATISRIRSNAAEEMKDIFDA